MNTIKAGYRLSVIDSEGTMLGDIDLEGYNLDKSMARSDIMNQVEELLAAEAYEEVKTRETR